MGSTVLTAGPGFHRHKAQCALSAAFAGDHDRSSPHDHGKSAYALHHMSLHRLLDQIGVATVNHRTGRSARQTDLLVERFEQKYPPF